MDIPSRVSVRMKSHPLFHCGKTRTAFEGGLPTRRPSARVTSGARRFQFPIVVSNTNGYKRSSAIKNDTAQNADPSPRKVVEVLTSSRGDVLKQQVISLAASGAVLGPLCDSRHSFNDVLHYTSPTLIKIADVQLLETCWWVPPLFAVAAVILGLSFPALDDLRREYSETEEAPAGGYEPSWPFVLGCISLFVVHYDLSGRLAGAPALGLALTGGAPLATDAILAATALLLWGACDRTPQGLFMSALTAVCGPLVEMSLINFGHLYHYTDPDFAGIPSWIAWVYFSGGPAVGNLGRRIRADLLPRNDDDDEGTTPPHPPLKASAAPPSAAPASPAEAPVMRAAADTKVGSASLEIGSGGGPRGSWAARECRAGGPDGPSGRLRSCLPALHQGRSRRQLARAVRVSSSVGGGGGMEYSSSSGVDEARGGAGERAPAGAQHSSRIAAVPGPAGAAAEVQAPESALAEQQAQAQGGAECGGEGPSREGEGGAGAASTSGRREDMESLEKEMVDLLHYEIDKVKSNILNSPQHVMDLKETIQNTDVIKGLQANLTERIQDVHEWAQSFDDDDDDDVDEFAENLRRIVEDDGDGGELQPIDDNSSARAEPKPSQAAQRKTILVNPHFLETGNEAGMSEEDKKRLVDDLARLKEEVERLQKLADEGLI